MPHLHVATVVTSDPGHSGQAGDVLMQMRTKYESGATPPSPQDWSGLVSGLGSPVFGSLDRFWSFQIVFSYFLLLSDHFQIVSACFKFFCTVFELCFWFTQHLTLFG